MHPRASTFLRIVSRPIEDTGSREKHACAGSLFFFFELLVAGGGGHEGSTAHGAAAAVPGVAAQRRWQFEV